MYMLNNNIYHHYHVYHHYYDHSNTTAPPPRSRCGPRRAVGPRPPVCGPVLLLLVCVCGVLVSLVS